MSYYITNSGIRIDLKALSMDHICIKDIAHHLTKICRYGGSLPLDSHYSVASHSMNLVKYLKRAGENIKLQRLAFSHDFTEAYLGDIVSGLKKYLRDYVDIENRLNIIICSKYKVDRRFASTIKSLDSRIILDEALKFFPDKYMEFQEQMPLLSPLHIKIEDDKDLNKVYNEFLTMADELGFKGV